MDKNEFDLLGKWLAIPHPDIEIARNLNYVRHFLPPLTPALEAEVAVAITPEQERLFALAV